MKNTIWGRGHWGTSMAGLKSRIKLRAELALVAHTCNCRYSGGRDHENHGLKPTRVNGLSDPS
jgi:hypothetical protein